MLMPSFFHAVYLFIFSPFIVTNVDTLISGMIIIWLIIDVPRAES